MAYRTGNIPADAPAWIVQEFQKVQAASNGPVETVVFPPLAQQPKKLFEGLTCVADGQNWDPLTLWASLSRPYKVCYLGGAWRQDA